MTQNSINTVTRLNQFVSTSSSAVINCNTQIPYDNTIPQQTEGTEVITLSITPTISTSTLVITFSCVGFADGINSSDAVIALFQDATADALAAIHSRGNRTSFLKYIMTSGTTSSTIFKIRAGGNNALGSYWINTNDGTNGLMGGVSYATFTIEEYV